MFGEHDIKPDFRLREQERNESISYKSATADLIVNEARRSVHISDIYADKKGRGDGSGLLTKIKETYPYFVISGNAMPTEFKTNSDEPSEEELIFAQNCGWDFTLGRFVESGFEYISPEDRVAARKIGEEMKSSRKDVFVELFNFYKKNGFDIDFLTGYFSSKPPHKIVKDDR